jgi:hypothetical protein
METYSGATEAHFGFLEAPVNCDDYPGAVEAHPVAMKAYPGVLGALTAAHFGVFMSSILESKGSYDSPTREMRWLILES